MSELRRQEGPIEGQSHWCDGDVVVPRRGRERDIRGKDGKSRSCANVVRNDSDHCAAGHKNRLRLAGVTSTDGINWSVHDSAWDSYEVGDLAVALRPAVKEPSREELVQIVVSADQDFREYSNEAERWISLDNDFTSDDNYLAAKDAQRRLFEAALKLSEFTSTAESRASVGWSHEEARSHTVVERLQERCRAYAGSTTCSERGVLPEDMCERCLAAAKIERLYALLNEGRELTRALFELAGLNPEGPLYQDAQGWLRATQNI